MRLFSDSSDRIFGTGFRQFQTRLRFGFDLGTDVFGFYGVFRNSHCMRIFLLGIAHLVVGPSFRYRGCIGRRLSDEAVIVKKIDMWP